MPSFTTERQIVNVPLWITAFVALLDTGFRALAVHATPLLRETDDAYRPVADYLSGVCHHLDSEDTDPSDAWMFGEVTTRIYTVYDECPGPFIAHTCNQEPVRV